MPTCQKCHGTGLVEKERKTGRVVEARVRRWCRLEPFAPTGPHQIIRYLAHKGYPIPQHKKENRDTTDEESLQKLARKTGDPLFPIILKYRAVEKILSTQVEGWRPASDGCVHSEFLYYPSTGQLASRSPNVQNSAAGKGDNLLKRKMAKRFRSLVEAKPDHLLVKMDYRSFHAVTLALEAQDAAYMKMARQDVHTFFAAAGLLKLETPERLIEMGPEEYAGYVEWFKGDSKRKSMRDKKAKPCIAEGQLVLTDKGLIPIEKVTIDNMVWDGVEWVSHSGVIYRGEKEVIEYDGLIATPDHEVVTQSGWIGSLRGAASRMARIECTGNGRKTVRTSHCDRLRAKAYERLHSSVDEMPEVWQRKMEGFEQPRSRKIGAMPDMCENQIEVPSLLREKVRFHNGSMPKSIKSRICSIWRAWNRVSILFKGGFCKVGGRESPTSRLQGCRDRQDKQRWPLRTWKSKVGDTTAAIIESEPKCVDVVSREEDSNGRVRQSLFKLMDEKDGSDSSHERRTNNISCAKSCLQGKGKVLAQTARVVGKKRVYDITNAGPRFCYTVSNKLVLNCILGVGFGLGAKHLWEYNEDSIDSKQEAQQLLDTLKGLFPKVFEWQQQIKQLANRQHYLKSRWGYVRWFWDVLWKGEQAEQAIAFLPANDAFGMMRQTMVELEERGLNERFGLCLNEHDALMFHCPQKEADGCIDEVRRVMERPCLVLRDPKVAPDGLKVEVEVEMGKSWGSLKEVRR